MRRYTTLMFNIGSDGILVQVIGDAGNSGNPDTTPRRPGSEAAVRELADLMAKLRRS